MATVKIAYSNSTTIDCTLSSLSSSSTLSRSSAFVDNSANLYDDALLYIAIKVSGTTQAADKSVFVYIYVANSGTNFGGSKIESVGSDASVNLTNPTNLLGPVAIATNGTSATYSQTVPIAQFFGGRMPSKWGFVVRNA